MKLVYTHENRFFVCNAQNILEQSGISTRLKNEYAQGAMGEVSVFDAWLELWVVDASDYFRAQSIIETAFQSAGRSDWVCHVCNEVNAPSFEFCWKCQASMLAQDV